MLTLGWSDGYSFMPTDFAMLSSGEKSYRYQGKNFDLKDLRTMLPKCRNSNIIGSVLVTTKNGIPVKLVYVKNRNKKHDWLVILSTDCSLSNEEIVRIYGNRWAIMPISAL